MIARNCDHPDFPLRRRERTHLGKPYAEWVRKIKKKRISFGAVSNDPDGSLAWRLHEKERVAWERGQNPRAGFQRLAFVRAFDPAWLMAGPLAKAGIGIIDAKVGRVVCLTCWATWRIKFSDPENIPKRLLRCPRKCAPSPIREVREAIDHAANPDLIPWQYREGLERARREGWEAAAPQDVDVVAAAEGKALVTLSTLAPKSAPRRKRRPTHLRHELIVGKQ